MSFLVMDWFEAGANEFTRWCLAALYENPNAGASVCEQLERSARIVVDKTR
jgi:hypothetical protein